MRIAMLCSCHRVNDERVSQKQALSLAKAGHNVIVFGREPDTKDALAPVELRPLGRATPGRLHRLLVLGRLYREATEWQPDVVVCHEMETAALGLILKVRRAVKMIFDVHECYHETVPWLMPRPLRSVVRAAMMAILKILISRSDWVTVVSEPNRKLLNRMRRDGRVDILHNSPPLRLFPQCSHDVRGPITVVHDGYLYRERGMLEMLEAVALVRRRRDIRFLIIGRVMPREQEVFDRKVSELGLGDAIIVPGWMKWVEIGKVESRAQIGLICHQYSPNSFLSLNNKLYNYMSCSQPVIGPEGSATADMIRRYDCGLCVDTSRPTEIAEAIEMLAGDVELRKRLGGNGRRAMEEELGWHRMEEKMERIYRQLRKETLGGL